MHGYRPAGGRYRSADMDGTLPRPRSTTTSGKRWCLETWGLPAASICREAKDAMRQEYHAVQHTLNWYCLDYWSERLAWIFVR